ncbi:hypothetical protein [Qipengyuania vesicularis]|uniref:hypothetical protein n=1 Tax=Qipengyuania vesicularis TaxID=2867232 RepID=UPI001C88C454|nr:hypothetical protein [Qipengyuania vesicularis]MBX7526108.1 hypothetical protein [Qipengyuania vesicularis]
MTANPAWARGDNVVTVAEAHAEELKASIDRGTDIYRYDQAAWHTTDALREDVANLETSGIRGWVVTEVDEGLLVAFWKESDAGYEAVYSAIYDGHSVSARRIHQASDAALTDSQVRLIEAGQVPDPRKLKRCTRERYNTVIMPTGKPDGSIFVYFLTPQEEAGVIPFGGHYRFEIIDEDVHEMRSFAKSCILLGTPSDDSNKELTAMAITHLLDPVPTELHVFAMLSALKPLVVFTTSNEQTWQVYRMDREVRIEAMEP